LSAPAKDGRKHCPQSAQTVQRDCAWINATSHYEEFDMHKLRFGLAALAVVGVIGGALADDSGHASINSLKWQMRRHHHSHYGYYASGWRACAVEQIGVMNGCRYNHRRQ